MPFDLVECGMCGKATVVGVGHRRVCDACRDEEQKLYSAVKSLLREHSHARLTVQDIAGMIKVSEKKITHLVESGYFKLVMQRVEPCE